MTPIDWLNLTSAGASLVLAIVAILGIYFYTQSKNTETDVKVTLASIKAQTDALQKLTGRWMDRLTRYATEKNPANENVLHILTAIHELPNNLIKSIQIPSPEDISSLKNETISCYIGLLYYCSLTNIFAQSNLPSLNDFDEKNDYQALVKKIVDQSAADVEFMRQILSYVPQKNLQENYYHHLYEQVNNFYLQFVKSSVAVFASRNESS